MTKKPASKFRLEALEPRLLFSAEAVAPPPEAAAPAGGIESVLESPLLPETQGAQDAQSNEQLRRELVFIDAGVSDYQQLLEDILEQKDAGRKIEAVVLESGKDGVAQISEYLSSQQNIDALHLISHGGNGAVKLGDVWVTTESLDQFADSIEDWQQALSTEADLLIYGCNLAAGSEGQALIDNLAFITGADVAASEDLTGHATRGGDWVLEYQAGLIETGVAPNAQAQHNWSGLLTAPTLNLPGGALDYYFNDPATVIDGGAIVSDPDSPNFNGGSLTVSFTANGTANDQLIIDTSGNFKFTGPSLKYSGTTIGTLVSSGSNGAPLALNLTSAATEPILQELLRNITYQNTSPTPSTAPRTVEFVLVDDTAASSNAATKTINVIDPAPVIDLDADDSHADGNDFQTTFYTGGGAVSIVGSDAVLSDVNSTQLSELTITITNPADKPDELLGWNLGSTGIGASWNANNGRLILSGNFDIADYQQVLDSITYENTLANPDTTARTITFVAKDTSGNTSATATTTVYIQKPEALWFTTKNSIDGSLPDLASWGEDEVLQIGGPTLGLGATTTGQISRVFDLSALGAGEDISALHFVSRDITVGTTEKVALKYGDIILSTKSDLTVGGSLFVNRYDLFVFRPDPGPNYSSGSFFMLMNDLSWPNSVQAITLIEQTTRVGDVDLAAGTFLFSRQGTNKANIYHYDPDVVGASATSGSLSLLIEGPDVGISDGIEGLDLIEADTVVGGQALQSGEILVTLGGNELGYQAEDVFVLNVTATEIGTGGGSSAATSRIFFDGSDKDLQDDNPFPGGNEEAPNGISLYSTKGASADNSNQAPTVANPIADQSVKEGSAFNFTFATNTFNDADVGDTLTYSATLVGGAPLPAWLSFNAATRTFSGTPGSGDVGTISVEVTADDGNLGTTTDQFDITVNPNAAPTVSVTATDNGTENTNKVYTHAQLLTLIGAADSDDALTDLDISISNLANGTLVLSGGTGGNGTTFTFTPDLDFVGDMTFDYQVTDHHGGASTVGTATVTINEVNVAPVLDNTGEMSLTNVVEDSTDPPGNSVATIIAIAGGDRITDANTSPLEGIAVIGVDNSDGTWEYSINGGASWTSFVDDGVANGFTDDTAAVLLDTAALIRFVPNPSYTGPAGVITFRAWDQTDSLTSGTFGVDVSVNGNATAYSTSTETATLTVVPKGGVINLLPAGQNVDEDTALVFSVAGGNSITVDDGSATDNVLRTTLSVSNGTLTLATLTGLTIESGANGTSTITVVGLESAINAALDGLTYDPAGHYNGADSLQVSTDLLADIEGYYTFDNPADPGKDDSASGANDATVTGATPVVDVDRGNVLSFDGNDSVRITGRFGDPANVTLAAWVDLNGVQTRDELISLGDNVAIRLNEGGAAGVQGFFYDGSTWRHTSSGSFLDSTGWHHVAYTFDDAANTQVLYIDGVAVATTNYSASISYTLGADTYLGRNGNAAQAYLHGSLDDARIYSRALSAEEIAILFQDQASHSANVAISVAPVGDTPQVANIPTDEDTQSGLIVINRHASDGAEVTHLRISGITGGTLYQADGVTQINDGDYITFAEGQAGLRFTPTANSNNSGSFNVESSEDGSSVAAQSGAANSTITVTPVGDTPSVANITTDEDTQSGLIVVNRHAADNAEVTHFRISAITGGTLYQADGVTQINNGDYITFAEGQAGLRFTPTANSNNSGSFNVESSEDGTSVAAQSGAATSTITVTPVGDTPSVANTTTDEDTQSGLIIVNRHAADGAEVTHFRISGITDGTLYQADGATQINNGDYITFAEGQAGLRFTPTANSNNPGSFNVESSEDGSSVAAQSGAATSTITVTPVGDTPTVADITTDEDTQSGLIVVNRHAADGAEVTHFRISGISGGTLYQADGVTQINDGDFITFAEGQAGLRFTPTANSNAAGSFKVEASEDGTSVAAQSGAATSTITVTPVGDTPTVVNITTDEDTQSGLIVINRHAADGAEVTHFRISGITGGILFHSDGITQINDGNYITFAEGQAGLRFTPAANSNTAGSFNVESSEDGSSVAAQSGGAASTITVTPIGDTPAVADITTDEDTQSGLIVINRHATDGAEVTHFRISGITGGTLFHSDGITQINDGDFITFAQGQAGVRFTPLPNSNADGTFNVEASEDGVSVAAQSGAATSTITVTSVGDPPQVADITTDEDTQSGLIVIDRNATDGPEVTHFRISNISGGTLYQADGVTQINDGDYITFAQGQAGVRFTPSADSTAAGSFDVESSEDGSTVAAQSNPATSTITVTPVGDTPTVANISTDEDTQSGLIVVNRHAADGAEVTHFRITGITGGILFHSDGITQINDGDYITFAQGQAGLRFTPTANSNAAGAFNVEASEDGATVAAQSGATASTITVTPVGDTPTVANITTDEDTQSGLIVINRHAADGAEVTHFRISGITAGTLYQADGVTQINDGDYITFAQAQAGLRFTPAANSNAAGSFNVESSENGSSVAAQSGVVTSTITVIPVGDTPQVGNISTDEDTQSGLIVIDRHAADGAEVTHFRISGVTGGILFHSDGITQINDGDYITFAEGQAGLRFTPTANSNAAGSFNVESSEDGVSVAAQSGASTSTITVTPVGDTPTVANITTDEDTQSGLIVIKRHAADGAEVTHFRISGITGGTLFHSDGITRINDGDYITFAQGQAGLRFTPTADSNAAGSFNVEASEDGTSVAAQSGAVTSTITVTPVGDTPQVANITTDEDTQSGLIVIDRHAADSAEVTHFRISGIIGGTLFHADGITQINDGDYITFAQGQAGLRFTPTANSNAAGSFNVESSEDGTSVAAQSGAATSTITVTPVGDTPTVANITTDEDSQSGLIVIDRHAADGAEVTHFRISGITGGSLFLADGVTQINDGDYITFAQGQAGLRFTPSANSNLAGSFNVEASEDGTSVAAQSEAVTSTITVTPVGDTPQVANITTDEDTQSGLIVIDRHAADGAEVTHFRISDITGGTLYHSDGVTQIHDGDYISFGQGQDGLRFTPSADSNIAGSFKVEASEDGVDVAAQSAAATSTIRVTPVNDTPVTGEDGLTTLEDNALAITSITDLLVNDTDIDGDQLVISSFTQPSHGSLVDNGDGTLTYTPDEDFNGHDSFTYTVSDGQGDFAIGTAIIIVTPEADTPQVSNVTTLAGLQSGLITINPHKNDGPEVTHFKISGITGGTLYMANGVTQVNNGDFITRAQAQAGLRFTPTSGSADDGHFNVEASLDGQSVSAKGAVATATVKVTTPIEKEQTQEEEKQEPVKEQPTEDEAASEALAPEKPEALPQPAGEPEGLMKLAEDEKKNSARDIQQARIPKPLLDNSSYTFDQTPLLIQEERPTEESGLSFIVKLQNAWEALDIEALSAETYEHLRDSLDAFKTETAEEMLLNRAAVGSAIVTSMGLSAGYVVWLLKGGSLLASVLSSMPAWQLTDPLSILASTRGREDDEESLESIIEDGSKKSDDQKKEDSEANKD